MSDYYIPERKFVDGPKKMVSWRLSEKMMFQLDRISKEKGWTTTDLVQTILDQFIQQEEKEKK